VAAGWLRADSVSARLLQRLLRYSLHRAELVVALDRYMVERILAKHVPESRVAVLPPWPHDAVVRYDPTGRERFRAVHGLERRHVVMYSGNHSPCHPLATLLEAALRLRSRGDIAFCFVGGGSEFETVKRFAREHALGNIVTVPYQPLADLSASLSAADLHVVVMGDPFVGLVHPCKVYNVRALGIPYLYIGPDESHVTELAPAFSARHGDVAAVVRHVEASAAGSPGTVATVPSSADQDALVGQLCRLLETAGSEIPARGPVVPRTPSNELIR